MAFPAAFAVRDALALAVQIVNLAALCTPDFLFQARQDTAPTSQYGKVKSLKADAKLFNFLMENGIKSMQELFDKVAAMNGDYYDLRGKIVKAESGCPGAPSGWRLAPCGRWGFYQRSGAYMGSGVQSAARFTIWTARASASRTAKAAGRTIVRTPPTGLLNGVPEGGAVLKLRRSVGRQHDFRMDNTALMGVVVGLEEPS